MENAKGSYTIADLDSEQRPREKLARLGPKQLTEAELLAILLRVGVPGENAVQVGQRLLDDLGGISGLYTASYDDICAQFGIGQAKAAQIKAAIELGRRLNTPSEKTIQVIQSPQDVADLLQYEMGTLEQEHLMVILLDTRNRVLGIEEVYRGSLNSSQVRVAEIFKKAIIQNAASIIVVHNHPSGDPTPSPDDIAITRAFSNAGNLLDIKVLDHVVISQGKFASLKERGVSFE